MKTKFALLLLLQCLIAPQLFAHTMVVPSDKRLQYIGRVDFSHPDAPIISWPNTSVAGNFTGPVLEMLLDDQFGKNYFNVFIDGDLTHPIIIEAQQGEKNYVITDQLPEGRHSFLLTKRTEGEEGATVLKKITLGHDAELLAAPLRAKHRIEFFGDSITSGMADEAAVDGVDDQLKDKNSFMSYAAITARNLNAEMHMTSQSGIGILISWFNFTMSQFYDQLSAVGNNDTQWDFSKWTPEVVVINLFQNDSWLIDRDKRLDPVPTDEQRIQAYVDFVGTIRSKYPKAYIVCTLGSMDATRPGSEWPGYIITAVARIKQKNAAEKMDTLFFEYTGYGKHPRVQQHQANAEKLTAFIKAKMAW